MPYKDEKKQKQAQHESYLRNKKKIIAKQRERRQKTRKWLWEYKKNLKCKKCGENRTPCLAFHHSKGDDHQAKKNGKGIAQMCENGIKTEAILEEINKCSVLCSNCHSIVHWNLRHPEEQYEL